MILDLMKIPEITFFSPSGARVLSIARRIDALAGRARRLQDRFNPGSRVGIIHRTSPNLVLDWFAALAAGLVPTILQFPTPKQNRHSWGKAISSLVEDCHLAGLLVADNVVVPGLGAECTVLTSVDTVPITTDRPCVIAAGEIIQMSSGTTGQRKPIAYSLSQIETHVAAYNSMMRMGEEDVVVSWLPLYHDMGFIACFLMPMIVGARLVLIDPVDWVGDPGLLYAAIRQWRGTVCYMPNFGFEVMARLGRRTPFPEMRKWISCAEPIAPATVRRFLSATGTGDGAFSACYAMAENVFAVTQSEGFQVAEVDGKSLTSCGPPIPTTDVKIIEGEIWVRSPTSIKAYLDGGAVADADGFYPTGDMGHYRDGGLVILGRKRDILIQAGTKYFLSDLDLILNEQFPDVRGRACALAQWSEREGTEHPLFLVERQRFFDSSDLANVISAVRAAGNLNHFELAFVPPSFITKTSSGKINRPETLRQWQAVQEARSSHSARGMADLQADIMRYFSAYPRRLPIGELLDSLGATILRMILSDYGRQYDPRTSLDEILADPAKAAAIAVENSDLVPGVNIVSCADGRHWAWMTDRDLRDLEQLLGCPIRFEHVCAPPVPALLSDLIFVEYFLPGRDGPDFAGVASLLTKIRSASVLLFDDIAELGFGTGIFPVLSHRFERDPAADLLCYRWQRYTSRHDVLPVTVADLRTLGAETRADGFRLLTEYIGAPLFRIAVLETHQDTTHDWEYREIISGNTLDRQQPATPAGLRAALFSFIEHHGPSLRRVPGPSKSAYFNTDLPHFCCAYIDATGLDAVLNAYESFAVIGPPQCVPYIRKRATELNKPVNYFSHWNANSLERGFDLGGLSEACILITGAWGRFEASGKPVFQVMLAYPEPLPDNLSAELEHLRYGFSGAPPRATTQSFFKFWS